MAMTKPRKRRVHHVEKSAAQLEREIAEALAEGTASSQEAGRLYDLHGPSVKELYQIAEDAFTLGRIDEARRVLENAWRVAHRHGSLATHPSKLFAKERTQAYERFARSRKHGGPFPASYVRDSSLLRNEAESDYKRAELKRHLTKNPSAYRKQVV